VKAVDFREFLAKLRNGYFVKKKAVRRRNLSVLYRMTDYESRLLSKTWGPREEK